MTDKEPVDHGQSDGTMNGSKVPMPNMNNQPLFGNTQIFGQQPPDSSNVGPQGAARPAAGTATGAAAKDSNAGFKQLVSSNSNLFRLSVRLPASKTSRFKEASSAVRYRRERSVAAIPRVARHSAAVESSE